MKQKILFYLKSLGIGGTEKSAQLFAKYINRDIFDIKVLYDGCGCLDRLKIFKRNLAFQELISYENEAEARHIISNIKPDIFQVFKSGFPDGFPNPEDVSYAKYCIYNIFGFFDPNPLIAKDIYMSEWLGRNKFSMLPENYPRFSWVNGPVEKPCTTSNYRKLLKIPDDYIVLGRTGRPDNGIYDAISVNAMSRLKDKYKFLYLVLAPPEAMLEDLNRLEIPHIAMSPTISDSRISKFYNTIDIYTHSRLDGETYGMNIAEAMMHGRPIITHYSRPNNVKVHAFQAQTHIVNHGENGFVADGVDQYTMFLETLLSNPDLCHEMGENAQEKALCEFEAGICARKLESIYMELINGR